MLAGSKSLSPNDNCHILWKKRWRQKSALSLTSSLLLKFADLFNRDKLCCCPRFESNDSEKTLPLHLPFLSFFRGFMRHTPTPSEGCRDAAKEIFFFSSPRAFQSSRRRNDPLLFPVPPGEIPCAAAWRPRGRLPSLPRSIPVASCKAVRPDAHDALAKIVCGIFPSNCSPEKSPNEG